MIIIPALAGQFDMAVVGLVVTLMCIFVVGMRSRVVAHIVNADCCTTTVITSLFLTVFRRRVQ